MSFYLQKMAVAVCDKIPVAIDLCNIELHKDRHVAPGHYRLVRAILDPLHDFLLQLWHIPEHLNIIRSCKQRLPLHAIWLRG